jgi:Holliday junction resolvase RusA-like endonuclease
MRVKNTNDLPAHIRKQLADRARINLKECTIKPLVVRHQHPKITLHTLFIDPVAKPRMTKRDKWAGRPVVERYFAYCNQLRILADAGGLTLRNGMEITFYVPMPKSWTKAKRDAHRLQPHQQKPDLDNFAKAIIDALLPEDKHIWHIGALKKYWDDTGSIKIKINGETK